MLDGLFGPASAQGSNTQVLKDQRNVALRNAETLS
jgi:hypothetical protein